MYAIIEDSGTQIKVSEGDVIRVAKRDMPADVATVTLSQAPNANGAYSLNTIVGVLANAPPGCLVTWSGTDSQNGRFATVKMNADRFVTVDMCS